MFEFGSFFAGTLFPLVFFVVIVLILVTVIRSLAQWNKNNQSPVLTMDASVTAKRTDVTHTSNPAGPNMAGAMTAHTTYRATFQVESGDRLEFVVSGHEYGMLAEGDAGKLTFQGTRYLKFERNT